MEMKLVESQLEKRDMQMDEIALLWDKRLNEFSNDLIEREETNCCGVLAAVETKVS